jgi:DNA-binding response OmpR family regulator
MNNTVLVYDDEESILEVIQIILAEKGYNVIVSNSGESVDSDIETYNPGLILLDIWMKGINGYEIAKQLKSSEKTKHLPIILISALNEAETIAEKAGADGFIKKPFDMDFLTDMVKSKILP